MDECPVMRTVRQGNINVAKLLLAHTGIDVDLEDEHRATAITYIRL